MRAAKERPSYSTLMSLIGALGNAGELKEMDKVLDEFARFDHRPGLDVITKMIYYHGSNGDIDG